MAIYTDYIAAALMYNLQILPESIMSGLIVLSIILANQSLLALTAGAGATQLLTGLVGRLIMRVTNFGVTSSSMDMCHTGFVGKSWERLLHSGTGPDLLWHPGAPSVFMATIGYFFGWGLATQHLYKEEIDAGVLSRATLTATTIISLLLLITALVFRISSGCESILGAVGGALFGLMIGYLGCIILGYATNRRATNVWGIPVLRDRLNGGLPFYICPSDSD